MPGKRYLKANSIDPKDFGDAKDFGRWIVEASFYDRGQIALNSSHNSDGVRVDIVEIVSYWASEYENDSWTILLLLDPNERKLRSKTNPELTIPIENHIYPHHIATEVLPSIPRGLMVQTESRPLYESIIKAHTTVTIEHDRSPSSGTAFVRNLIRASWEELVYRTEFDVYQILVEDGFEYRIYTGDDALEQKNAEIDRNTQSCHDLIVQRRGVLDWRKQVENIIYVFSMDVIDQRLTPHLPTKHTCLLEQERRIWARLHRGLTAVEATISGHMEAFSARVALEGSFAASRQAEAATEQTREANKQTKIANDQTKIANRHARSAGQLTKIATVIVPCTFVASIFSMGGLFAAGERACSTCTGRYPCQSPSHCSYGFCMQILRRCGTLGEEGDLRK